MSYKRSKSCFTNIHYPINIHCYRGFQLKKNFSNLVQSYFDDEVKVSRNKYYKGDFVKILSKLSRLENNSALNSISSED